jgi:hypothetical protein
MLVSGLKLTIICLRSVEYLSMPKRNKFENRNEQPWPALRRKWLSPENPNPPGRHYSVWPSSNPRLHPVGCFVAAADASEGGAAAAIFSVLPNSRLPKDILPSRPTKAGIYEYCRDVVPDQARAIDCKGVCFTI